MVWSVLNYLAWALAAILIVIMAVDFIKVEQQKKRDNS
jgi:hypothetical protein